jgi:2-oxoisovalerate dehydrogenase E1 component
MAALINHGLHDLLLKYPQAILFGEDVARKGGVYHVTSGLHARFGAARVFDTLLDETTILGLAIGAAHTGLLPIPEIQYLAYYHNAEDQIRGEAASLQFFSNARYRNPMVIRIAGWAYQKGFGGHFHNDNSIAALRDVPGLVIGTPSRGDDAVKMMRTCMALAHVDGRVSAFVEPIALYMTRDLYEHKDGLWSFPYPAPGEHIPLGQGAVYRGGVLCEPQSAGCGVTSADHTSGGGSTDRPSDDLTILTFANGVPMSLRAARTLCREHTLNARVVDLRWLNPLNQAFVIEQSLATGNVLVVDEGRRTGGVAEAILALIHEHCGSRVRASRLNALDTYIPLGPAADFVLPQDRDVVSAALALLRS